jgi:hypothetical protein
LVADNAFIFANTRGSEEGQGIDIGVTDQVTVRNGALITTDTFDCGSGGDLTVEAGSLEVRGGAVVSAGTFGRGDGGQLLVEADRVFLGDGATFFTGITSQAGPGSSGDVGDLTVRAGSLEVREGAKVLKVYRFDQLEHYLSCIFNELRRLRKDHGIYSVASLRES